MATRQAGRSRPRPDGDAGASRGRAKRRPASRGRRFRRRYAVVYDIEGPRVRLGMLWFVVAAVALAIGPFSTVAGLRRDGRDRRRRRSPACGGDDRLRPNEVVAAGDGGGDDGRGVPRRGRRRHRRARRRGRRAARGDRRQEVTAPLGGRRRVDHPVRAVPRAGGDVDGAARHGSTRGRRSRCCCSSRPTRPATTSWAREPGTPTRGPPPAWPPSSSSPSWCRRLPISTLSFGEAWLFGGIVAVLAPARPAVRQRAPPDRGLARVRPPPPRLPPPRRPRLVHRHRDRRFVLARLTGCAVRRLRRQVLRDEVPVDEVVEEGGEVGGALVPVVDVVGVLPHVDRQAGPAGCARAAGRRRGCS